MTKETRYVCSYCGGSYKTLQECQECEERHAGRLERVLYWQPMPPRPDDATVAPYRVEEKHEN